MATIGGPNMINDGLVFLYDAANIKSFRGEPTTNLLANPIDMTLWGGQQITVESTPSAYHVIDGKIIPFYRVTSTSTTDPFHSVVTSVGAISGKTFSFSIWAYTDESQSDFAQVFQYGASPFNSSTVSAVTYTLTTEPQKLSVTNTYAADVTNTNIQTRIDLQQGGSLGYIYVGAAQLEEKSKPTKFVDGTRGTTVETGGGWADLSKKGNHGQLVNEPVFNENNKGSLTFDGVDDSISVPYNSSTMDFSDAQTICMWLKPATGADSLRRNPYNQAYGGSGTLTHEPNRTINYYFGTNGGNSLPYVGRNSVFTVEPEELAFVAVSRSQELNVCNWYKNGVLETQLDAAGYSAVTNSTANISIAAGYVNNFLGNIYYVAVYNTYKDESDMAQIYNATKSRFGL